MYSSYKQNIFFESMQQKAADRCLVLLLSSMNNSQKIHINDIFVYV